MAVGADGTIYAIAGRIDEPDRTDAVRWGEADSAESFVAKPDPADRYGSAYGPRIEAIAPAVDGAYITIGRMHDGAYVGVQYDIARWVPDAAKKWEAPQCANIRFYSSHMYAVDGRRIALTLDPSSNSPGIDLSNPTSVEANLPDAVLLDGNRCDDLGAAILTGLKANVVVGYVGYLDGKPAPWFVNQIVQRMMARRWIDGRVHSLGAGVPFATTSDGIVAGATALPGHPSESMTGNFFGPAGTYAYAVPHAVVWSRDGTRNVLFQTDRRSAAYDIDERGTVVGMLERDDGRHFAFVRRHGRTRLLDDLPHPKGWRFESAYAIAPDGSIIGIGTYRGVATAFAWRASSP